MTVLETMSADRAVAVIRAPRIADPAELVASGDHKEIARQAEVLVRALG